jgi:5'-methylthioadenosine phosphorylase
VKKVLADSTCGSLNKVLQPRDFIIAHDVIDLSQTQFSGLAGRMNHLCLAKQLFCPALVSTTAGVAREIWPRSSRVYGHASEIVIAHNWGPRFTSAAEARAYRLLGADAVNQSIAPEASAIREIGACFVSASYVVSYEVGVISETWKDLDSIHEDLAVSAGSISLLSIARAELTDECGCAALRVERSANYRGT